MAITPRRRAARIDFALWRKLYRYAARYPRDLTWLVAFALATAGLEVCFPLLTRSVIDAVARDGMQARIGGYLAAYLVCLTGSAIAIGGFVWLGGKIRSYVSHDIRRDGFANLQRLSFSYFDHRPVGWLMARMTSDCERLSTILAWGTLDFVWGLSLMIGIGIVMLLLDVRLALVVLAVIPVLAWVSARFQRRILRSARRVRATNARVTAAFNEGIMGVSTSKAFVREQANLDEFKHLTRAMYGHSVLNQTQGVIYLPIVITLASLATGLALAVGGVEVVTGAVSIGTLIAFLAYTRHFFEPVEQLGRWFAEMQMARASAERILGVIEAEPEIRDMAPALAPPAAPVIDTIELRDVCFAYDPARPVLRDVNLTVRRGEHIAIVGPTGGGKSTLVNVICRFYEPTSGEVRIDGRDYRTFSLNGLQSKLGIVLQNAHVFSDSILENIRFGRLAATDMEVITAAKLAGAHDFIMALPDGYATAAGEGGARLSAGQKQLVSFARAILADPQILVLDEATSSVDTETEQHIQCGLAELLRGRIAFVIAHRLSTIRNATRIIVIDRGRIIERGSHAELMAQRGRYFRLYRQQQLREISEGKLETSGSE